MTSAFGKVILLGEHAVVYGHAALAGAIDRTISCTATESSEPTALDAPEWKLHVSIEDEGAPADALRSIVSWAGLEDRRLAIHADARLPAGSGLGSSAALAVALARALASFAGKDASLSAIEAAANRAERFFHKNPSGVDVALAARGGIGLYRRDRGFTPIEAPAIELVVGLSGESRNTAAMVAKVARAREHAPEPIDRALRSLGEAAEAGARALVENFVSFGGLMNDAQETLASLGLSTRTIDSMVESARSTGALGAKLTGAGGGGAVIALAPGAEEDVLSAWRSAGHRAFLATVGARQ